ncbi:patatin-like phospholipase family protein (plasmid) [Rhizobium leguminosarum]
MTSDEQTKPRVRELKDILKDEYKSIRKRRGAAETDDPSPPADLFGVALSGGGIRSASFSLGALQALNSWGLIGRLDYLSTVSGGGYIGTSMIAAMNREADNATQACKFPFSRGDQSIGDCEAVSHLRDYSRFLAPRGFRDIVVSAAIVLRGLTVNIIFLLAFLLPLATVFILANPTTSELKHSILLDLANPLLDGSPRLKRIIADPFILSKSTVICLTLWLAAWALWRSYVESLKRQDGEREPDGLGARVGRGLIIILVVFFIAELQPTIILLVTSIASSQMETNWFKALTLAAASILPFIASFQAKIAVWIQRALHVPSIGARLRSVAAKGALYGAALTLPLMIYGVFLVILIWGIRGIPFKCPYPCTPAPYPFTPALLVRPDWRFSGVVSGLTVLFIVAKILRSTKKNRLRAALGALRLLSIVSIVGIIVLLGLAAYLTRSGLDKSLDWISLANFKSQDWRIAPANYKSLDWDAYWRAYKSHDWDRFWRTYKTQDWIVLANYLALSLAALVVASEFTENANGLHKLYRDRLRVAYRICDKRGDPLKLSKLSMQAPYLLVNATLNVRLPRKRVDDAAGGAPNAPSPPDPAKRGRNAEFFIFSKHAIGSDSTGYADPEQMEEEEPNLDLAAAAAISGAAVSSSMGRIGIGLLGPTLALLNLRLGFWLSNPSMREEHDRSWEDILRLYLFDEAFGRLRSDSLRIYVTDGGHIDNLGLYQLLKRRCKFILVIDAEADPGMNFSAFADVQRFARIDEGTLVSLDWRPVRYDALERLADLRKTRPESIRSRHFAVGSIDYGNGEKGVLLYVKAAVRGDEPDYVLDYERRYPEFPHEATSDQFFSEEQMEAYRALGYHAVDAAFSEAQPETCVSHAGNAIPTTSVASMYPKLLLAYLMERLGATRT